MLLNFRKTTKLLKKYNIPIVKTEIIDSQKEAVLFAKKNDFPVVLKVFSPEVLHRTEKGLVILNINNKEQLKESFNKILKKSDKLKQKNILIQKQGKGTQIICGMKRNVSFGPVLMFGLGGVFVEVLEDVSFGIAPLSKKEASQMIKRIKGYKILKGFRGYPKADLSKISQVLTNLSRLAQENEDIKSIDLNPVFVNKSKIEVADPKIIRE